MPDIRGGGIYGRSEIHELILNNEERSLCVEFLESTCWCNYLIFDTFEDSAKRATPDPYGQELEIKNMRLRDRSSPSITYGFTSKTYADVQAEDIEKIVLHTDYDNTDGGDVLVKVSVNGGVDYTTIIDTNGGINKDSEEVDIPISERGNDVIVKLEITTDTSGNGAFISYYALLF